LPPSSVRVKSYGCGVVVILMREMENLAGSTLRERFATHAMLASQASLSLRCFSRFARILSAWRLRSAAR
jgi:hypothetical protein